MNITQFLFHVYLTISCIFINSCSFAHRRFHAYSSIPVHFMHIERFMHQFINFCSFHAYSLLFMHIHKFLLISCIFINFCSFHAYSSIPVYFMHIERFHAYSSISAHSCIFINSFSFHDIHQFLFISCILSD